MYVSAQHGHRGAQAGWAGGARGWGPSQLQALAVVCPPAPVSALQRDIVGWPGVSMGAWAGGMPRSLGSTCRAAVGGHCHPGATHAWGCDGDCLRLGSCVGQALPLG